tara:strand:- start:222 stop:746 length:525 start_codon:yes stop_codon:yes gene_type:complete
MAKSDSFFIRFEVPVTVNATPIDSFNQIPVSLGSYVDALGQAVLRIHNIEYEWVTSTDQPPKMDGNKASPAAFQITTQSQTGLTSLFDKSTVAKGMLWARNPDSGDNPPATTYNDSHAPQHFTNGYLVAVETLYAAAQVGADWKDTDLKCCVVMECTIEKMSQSAAMALALSQQ